MKKGELRELYQMMFPEYPGVVTVKELREMLGISRKLAYKLIDYGYIHAVKIGKSWLMLWLGLQVAQGNSVWGLPTLQCDVLYLSLEDTQRRIKDRLYNLTDSAPDNLYFAVTSGLIGGGLEEQITDFLTEQEKQKLLENARFCSLSLSEYLRRLGLGKEVRAAIAERDYRLFRMLNGLKAELPQLQKEEILSRLEAILNELK